MTYWNHSDQGILARSGAHVAFAVLLFSLSGLTLCGAADAGRHLIPVAPKDFPELFEWTDTCNVYVLKHDDAAILIDLGDGSVLTISRRSASRTSIGFCSPVTIASCARDSGG